MPTKRRTVSKKLHVDASVLELFCTARDELVESLDELERLAERYPVEITFGEYRFVFNSVAEIHALIDEMTRQIEAFKTARAENDGS